MRWYSCVCSILYCFSSDNFYQNGANTILDIGDSQVLKVLLSLIASLLLAFLLFALQIK